MTSQGIPKSEAELLSDIIQKKKLLDDAIKLVRRGDSAYLQIISTMLRSLICDTNGNKGVLRHLVDEYKFPGKIVTGGGDTLTLNEYLGITTFAIQSDDFSASQTRAKVIQEIAQQDGGSHGGTERKPRHYIFMSALNLGRSDVTDPYRGVLLIWGAEVSDFANRFLNWVAVNISELNLLSVDTKTKRLDVANHPVLPAQQPHGVLPSSEQDHRS